jgi:hypothetical protein
MGVFNTCILKFYYYDYFPADGLSHNTLIICMRLRQDCRK